MPTDAESRSFVLTTIILPMLLLHCAVAIPQPLWIYSSDDCEQHVDWAVDRVADVFSSPQAVAMVSAATALVAVGALRLLADLQAASMPPERRAHPVMLTLLAIYTAIVVMAFGWLIWALSPIVLMAMAYAPNIGLCASLIYSLHRHSQLLYQSRLVSHPAPDHMKRLATRAEGSQTT